MSFFRGSGPSHEEIRRESAVKQRLTDSLKAALKVLQQEHVSTEQPIYSQDSANSMCNVLEGIFLHGLKAPAPAMNFWNVLCKVTHRDVISQINHLGMITTEVGMCRAWIRLALNDGVLESYLDAIMTDKDMLRHFYRRTAYLRDLEHPGIMKSYVQGMSDLQFQLAYNSSMLNLWTNTPLWLAGLVALQQVPRAVVAASSQAADGANSRARAQPTNEVYVTASRKKTSHRPKAKVKAARRVGTAGISGDGLQPSPVPSPADPSQLTRKDIEEIRNFSRRRAGSDDTSSAGTSQISHPDPIDARQLNAQLPELRVSQADPSSDIISGSTPDILPGSTPDILNVSVLETGLPPVLLESDGVDARSNDIIPLSKSPGYGQDSRGSRHKRPSGESQGWDVATSPDSIASFKSARSHDSGAFRECSHLDTLPEIQGPGQTPSEAVPGKHNLGEISGTSDPPSVVYSNAQCESRNDKAGAGIPADSGNHGANGPKATIRAYFPGPVIGLDSVSDSVEGGETRATRRSLPPTKDSSVKSVDFKNPFSSEANGRGSRQNDQVATRRRTSSPIHRKTPPPRVHHVAQSNPFEDNEDESNPFYRETNESNPFPEHDSKNPFANVDEELVAASMNPFDLNHNDDDDDNEVYPDGGNDRTTSGLANAAQTTVGNSHSRPVAYEPRRTDTGNPSTSRGGGLLPTGDRNGYTISGSTSVTNLTRSSAARDSAMRKSSSLPKFDLGKSPPLEPELSTAMATKDDVELADEAILSDFRFGMPARNTGSDSNGSHDASRRHSLMEDAPNATFYEDSFDALEEERHSERVTGNSLVVMEGWSSDFVMDAPQGQLIPNQTQDSFTNMVHSYGSRVGQIQAPSMTQFLDTLSDTSSNPTDLSTTNRVMSGVTPQFSRTAAATMLTALDPVIQDEELFKDYDIVPDAAESKAYLTQPRYQSFLSSVEHITNEKGLDVQNYQCKGCTRPVGMFYGRARVCSLDGSYYCYECHENAENYIPARIVYNWDFRKHLVCRQNDELLGQTEEEPLMNIEKLNPRLYKHVPEMDQVMSLRTQLRFLKAYLFSCQQSVADEFRRRVWPREYLYDDIHVYSLTDLLQVMTGQLAQELNKVIKFATRHVYDCRLCSQKGFICEICNKQDPIYPFEMDTTYRCPKCQTVYHKECKKPMVQCPKCDRRRQRIEAMGTCADTQDSDSDYAYSPDSGVAIA